MKTFSDEIKNAFEYAVETEDEVLFDALANRFCTESQKLKNELLLLTAKKAKTPNLIEHTLALGGQLSYTEETGSTLLHYAAASSHIKAVQFFLEKGLSVNARNNIGATPLFAAAAESGSRKVIQALLKAGGDIKAKTDRGDTLLHMAAAFNPYSSILQFFLDQGLSVEDKNSEGYTALFAAARWQESNCALEILQKAGSDLYARAENGDTIFHIAAMNPNPEPAKWLKDYFSTSERNNVGESCLERALSSAGSGLTLEVYLKKMQHEHLMLAYKNQVYGVIKTLAHSGYNLNLADKNGTTVLMQTAKDADLLSIDNLLSENCDENRKDNLNRNVLHYAAVNPEREVFEITRALLGGAEGDLATSKDKSGHTPDYYLEHPEDF